MTVIMVEYVATNQDFVSVMVPAVDVVVPEHCHIGILGNVIVVGPDTVKVVLVWTPIHWHGGVAVPDTSHMMVVAYVVVPVSVKFKGT